MVETFSTIKTLTMRLKDELDYVAGEVVRKVIAQNDSGVVILMAFDINAEIGTHTAPAIAVVQILEGTCLFTLEEKELTLKAGDYLVMQPGTRHSLRAPEKFKMVLTKLNV